MTEQTTYYSPASNSFYDSRVSTPPSGSAVVADADYISIMDAIHKGASLSAASDGTPQVKDAAGNVIALASVAATASFGPVETLVQQATSALQRAASASWAAYGMYGETPPETWQTYLTSLREIANGTDKTSTTLPTAPTS